MPDAGKLIQQVQPDNSKTIQAEPRLSTSPPKINKITGKMKINVREFSFTGNKYFDSTTLRNLIADAENTELTLEQLHMLAERISDFYRANGHIYANAIIPPQSITSGNVTIQIMEARFASTEFNNKSRIDSDILKSLAVEPIAGQPIVQTQLDRTLLIMSDLPGVTVQGILAPADSYGKANLTINTEDGAIFSGSVNADNYGNSYTGLGRASSELQINSPLNRGDQIALNSLTSGQNLKFGQLSYEIPLNGKGSRARFGISDMNYIIGGDLAAMDARGGVSTGSIIFTHPFSRGVHLNTRGVLSFESMHLREKTGAISLKNDRAIDSIKIGLMGDIQSNQNDSSFTWSLNWTRGKVRAHDKSVIDDDALTRKTMGRFHRISASSSVQFGLQKYGYLLMSLDGQWSDKNLDSSQKFSIGGPNSVRAFELGAGSGDVGVHVSLEYHSPRYYKPSVGSGKIFTFLDAGYVLVNRNPWTTDNDNKIKLPGAGLGMILTGTRHWELRSSISAALSNSIIDENAKGKSKAWVEFRYIL